MGEQMQAPDGREMLYPAWALSLILLGLAKKWWWASAIADYWVNPVFDNPWQFDGASILLAIYGYSAQLFFDFSGYSDLVIGLALLLGFRLPDNFNMPFYAHNIREFWHRWHMSLSSWIRDYIFIPLGGSRKGFKNTQSALFIAMILSGLWHGSGLNFLIWGALHGLFLIGLNITDSIWGRDKISSYSVGKVIAILVTFHFVCFSFLIFRAESFEQGMILIKALFNPSQNQWSGISLFLILLVFVFLALYQWIVYAFWAWVEWLENHSFYYWIVPITFVLWIIITFAPSGIPNFIYANF